MTDKTETPELLPCPFCDGDASLTETIAGYRWYSVECVECGAKIEEADEVEAIAAWNTRSQDAEVERLSAAVHVAKDELRNLGSDPDDIDRAIARVNRTTHPDNLGEE